MKYTLRYRLLAGCACVLGTTMLVKVTHDNAYACTQVNNTPTTLESADVVFMGKLTAINGPDYSFDNLQEWTGTKQPSYDVTIDAASPSNPCGKYIDASTGDIYIIYQTVVDAFEGIIVKSGTTAFTQQQKSLNDQTDRYCSSLYAPVCGKDGKTYLNSCSVGLAEKQNKRTIGIGYTGECVISCRYSDPFCGNDRKTYMNKCAADAAGVSTGNFGICDNRTTTQQSTNTTSSCTAMVQYCYMNATVLVRACDADVGNIPPLSKAGACGVLISSGNTTITTNNAAPTACTTPLPYCLSGKTNYYDTVCNLAPSGAVSGACANTNTTITVEDTMTASPDTVVQWLFDNGLTMRATVDTFQGSATITREQAAKFYAQYATNVLKKTPDTSKSCTFSDLSTANPGLQDSITQSCQLGLFAGSNGKFYPLAPLSNAEAITVMIKMAQGELTASNPRYKVYYDKASSMNLLRSLSPLNDYSKVLRSATRINVGTLMFRYANQ